MKVLNGKIHLSLLFLDNISPCLLEKMNVPISTQKFIWGKGIARQEVGGGSLLNQFIRTDSYLQPLGCFGL